MAVVEEWVSGDVRLICGDCLEILPTLPIVDALITDPPYGLDAETPFDTTEAALETATWRCAAVILDWRNPIRGPRKVGELVWEYGWVSGFRSQAKSGVCHTHNTIHLLGDAIRFHFTEGSIIKRQPGFSSPRHCSFAHKTGHPHEKPVPLMAWLLARIDAETVCDPFMGTGATGIACVQLGRAFIGIEKNADWYAIAKQRIEQTVIDKTAGVE